MDKVKVAELVEDFDLYPRSKVDATHVAHIVDALRAGCTLPPIVVDRRSKRIVDGLHRSRAMRRYKGKKATIGVEWRTFKNDAELYLAAMVLNASHGSNLTPFDRTVAITKAMKMEIDPKRIASALNMTVERVTKFTAARMGRLQPRRVASGEDESTVALKMPVRHMAGKTLTKAQIEVMPKLGGNNQLFLVNSLLRIIRTRLLDRENEPLMERLTELARLLDEEVLAVAEK